MSIARIAWRTAGYLWASPNSALGALAGLAVLCLGGRARYHTGTLEFGGGLLGKLVERLPARCRFSAITFGHVILGIDESVLAQARVHERVHVRQYECWGPFFLPAYALSSAWQLACGRCAYRDNFFERAAFATEAETRMQRHAGPRVRRPVQIQLAAGPGSRNWRRQGR
jgi:hypothetical protein